ncbi:MAG: hypothetical protein PHR57_00890 [Patescibacteria group bacterium]|nr:hypothetical protein [Patescibacteria group bacterium]
MKRKKILKIVFVSLILICTILIIATPFLTILDLDDQREIFLQAGIIFGLMVFIYLTHFFYFQQTKKRKKYQGDLEERLLDSFKYIGTVNLQLEELRKNLFSFKKYPSSRKEFSKLMFSLAEKILSIINTDWVIVKIVDVKTKKTIHYASLVRGGKEIKLDKFDNNLLFEGKNNQNFSVVKSSQENLKIKAICVLPEKIKNQDEAFFLSHIINQLELLFLAFCFLEKK